MGIVNKIFEAIQTIEKISSTKITFDEQEKQNKFRKSLRNLYNNKNETDEYWLENIDILYKYIENNDARFFLHCDAIRFAMFSNVESSEYEYLKKHKNWTGIKNMIQENRVGNPKRCLYDFQSSSNLIHHAYSLQFGLDQLNLSIQDIHSVFEFGGGYGSFCRLLFQGHFVGNYTIYDLNAFSLLQEYYLSHIVNVPITVGDYTSKQNCINLIFNDKQLESVQEDVDLFVALWSLSECPESLRDKIFEKVHCNNYLIAYSHQFHGKDNIQYFNNLEKRLTDFNIIQIEMAHMKGHSYFLAQRIK